MLLQLDIENFIIVDKLSLNFESGFTAITGETGAGKSILIDAISMTLGDKAETSMVRENKEKATISAIFDISNLRLFLSLAKGLLFLLIFSKN